MRFDLKNNSLFPFYSYKHNHIFVKFVVCFLLFGLAFRFLSSLSFRIYESGGDNSAFVKEENLWTRADETPDTGHFPVNGTLIFHNSTNKCDVFDGNWVRDPLGPLYTNESCLAIEAHQNCMKNGRPDSEFLFWKWKPRGCDIERFRPDKFLEMMRNKAWAFIGDSIQRNHVQSLLCSLSQIEEAIEVYHDKEYRSKRWHFPIHNFTLSVIWSPFLVKAAIFEDINGVSSSEIQLHLDKPDSLWTKQYENFDYVIISGGKWFLKTAIYYENDTIIGCHYCQGKTLTELGYDHGYRKALQVVFDFINNSKHKSNVFFRTTTPDHFENGEWFSGGYCNRTEPFLEGEIDLNLVDTNMRNVETDVFENSNKIARKKEVRLRLLDTTHLSLLRPDGHPGVYRTFHPFSKGKNGKTQNDCLHWCLPGPIDSWNDLLMYTLSSA